MNFILAFLTVILAALLGLVIIGERGHPFLPSTRAIFRRVGRKRTRISGKETGPRMPRRRRNPLLDGLHAYVYARWTNQYISTMIHAVVPRLNPQTREHWANSYHGKVLTPELAAEIITLDHDVNARNLEQIIPYPMARDIVLKSPLPITLYECACRHARPGGGCKPTDVCLTIGGGTADFLVEHNPHSARRITQAQALEILRAEHARGHLQSAWFKDVLGDRMFAICNCCKCCCGGIEAMTRYGVRTMVSSGFVAQVDESNCTACGLCVDHCPFEAIHLPGTLAEVNENKCMGCGVCESQCAFEAIALVRDPLKPEPLDVRVL